jgi:hypothetical protein
MKRAERALVALLALTGVLSIAIFPTRGGTAERQAIRGGIVRLGADPWLHDDDGHAPVGITRVYVTSSCDLRVVLRDQPGDRITTQTAEEDSALLSHDIAAGIDGGAESATVSLWRRGEHVCVDDPMLDGLNADVRLEFVVWGQP